MEWIIDDISEVLEVTDVNKILHKYFHEGKGRDPIVYFYETFLAEYDPKMREKRGVYYTPEPVVSYIVRSLNHILKERFNKPHGFASDAITVLDPAAGTLTFLAETAKLATNEFTSSYGAGGKTSFIRDNILNNLYAFELMMAPYAIGHLKMSFLLEELGYDLQVDERFKLYLTNTLEMEELAQTDLPGMASLSEESHLAGKVKKEQPIMVILGNPPYSVSSANKSNFIEGYFTKKERVDKKGTKRLLKTCIRGIMDDYKDDVKQEKNIQPLSDDYIKFIRFAHWKIEKVGKGLIGLITNNSYLSGLIHRGMRKKLLESLNDIYILNLHGNSRIGETAPDGSKDENVFDIQQGVSIVLLVKDKKQQGLGKVYYEDVYGLRENKYELLNNNASESTNWREIQPTDPNYFFVEKDFSLQTTYDRFTSIYQIFNKYSFGVTTARDHFVIGFKPEEIKQKMRTFVSDLPDDLVAQGLKIKNTNQWVLKDVREAVKTSEWNECLKTYSYRPFDERYICYTQHLIERDRFDIMQHVIQRDNIGLSLTRRLRDPIWQHIYVSQFITDKTILSSRDNCYFIPLYLYSNTKIRDLFSHSGDDDERGPNINPKLFNVLKESYKQRVAPEQIFYFIYGVLYSNIYRTTYAEFLKIDFPSVPFTKDYKLFTQMSKYGNRLVDLHLLKSKDINKPIAKFQGTGNERIEKLKYVNEENRLYINKDRYFEGIPEEVWEYQIGGYQVCEKWLKDRKGKRLSVDDIKHYCKVVTALQKTIEVQREIDDIYPEVEKDVIEFK
jgi:predicted helicase